MFTLYLRGRLARIDGWVEGADRSVGIFGDTFYIEEITFLDEGVAVLHDGSHDGITYESGVISTLTASEFIDIDRVFWAAQRPLFDPVYSFARDHEHVYEESGRCVCGAEYDLPHEPGEMEWLARHADND